MAKTIASLAVEVLARTEKFEQGSRIITGTLDRIEKINADVSRKVASSLPASFVKAAKEVSVIFNAVKQGVHVVLNALEQVEKARAAVINKIASTLTNALIDSAKATTRFLNTITETITAMDRLAVKVEDVGKKIAVLAGKGVQFALKLPVGDAVTGVLTKLAAILKTIITVGIGIAAMATVVVFWQRQHLLMAIVTSKTWDGMIKRLSLLGAAWGKAFSSRVIDNVGASLALLAGKLMVVSGIAGGIIFLGMAAAAESADRKILGLIGKLTPLQQALAKVHEAWLLWVDLVAGNFFNTVGLVLDKIASGIIGIIQTLRYVNDMTGGWLKSILSLVGISMSLYTAWKLVAYLSSFLLGTWKAFAGLSFIKPVIASVTFLAGQLWAAVTAQTSLTVSTMTYMKTQIGLKAVAIWQGICAAATWAWTAAQIALNVAATYFMALTVVGLAAVAVALAASALYMNSQAAKTEAATAASVKFHEANHKLADSLEAAGQKSVKAMERLKELADFAKKMNEAGLTVEQKDLNRQKDIAGAKGVRESAKANLDRIYTDEAVPLMTAIARIRKTIESQAKAGGLKNFARAEEMKKILEAHEQKLDAVQNKLKDARELAKNVIALDAAGEAAANKQRIADNLNALNIDLIKSAEEVYAEKLKNLDKALSNKWINLGQYNRQLESASKAFREADPAMKVRIEAEKKLADAMEQSAKSIRDSLKTPWQKFEEQNKLVDNLLKSGKLNEYDAADAKTKNRADLRSALSFADIQTPSEILADRLYDLGRITKEFGTSEIQAARQIDKLAGEFASASGIGDLFDALHGNRVAGLAKALDGIEGLEKIGKATAAEAADMRLKASRKFLKEDEGPQKGSTLVQRGTTEAYQRDQEVKREAVHAQKQLEELQKLQAEAEKARKSQEDSKLTLGRIEEFLKSLKSEGV